MRILWAVPMAMGVAGCDHTPLDPRGLDRGETLLSVTGTGRTEAVPDQALFTAGLSSLAANARAASAANAATMSRIATALAKLSVPSRDIQTRNLSVNRIGYGSNKGQYEATNMITVRMRDPAKVGEAIAAVTDVGANIVSGPNLSVSDPEKANLEGYGIAYKAARAKAEAYASAAGLRIVRVLTIQDGGGGGDLSPQGDMAMPPPVSVQTAAPPVMSGTNAATVGVRVNFVLAPK